MIENYFKISIRNIFRRKGYTFLNLLSLSTGLTCFLFVMLYVNNELSYDKFAQNHENIYRVSLEDHVGSPAPLLPACINKIPEVIKGARFYWATQYSGEIFSYGKKSFKESKFFLADTSVFDLFSYKFLMGTPQKALNTKSSLVITKSIAEKYFGKENPIGKTLVTSSKENYIITGVIEDVPLNSHLRFDFLGKFPADSEMEWGQFNFLTYFQTTPNASPKEILKKIGEIYTMNSGFKKNPFQLQKLTDIHLNSHKRNEIEQNGYLSNVYLYSIIAIIVLLVACINYTNLLTAQFAKRGKEVGIRKVIGAGKNSIIMQFVIQASITIIGAIVITSILVELLSSPVNSLLEKHLQLSSLGWEKIIAGFSFLLVFIIIFSAGYPAFYLTSINPASVIKEDSIKTAGSGLYKKTLVVIQFAFSIFFLVAALIISSQMNYLTTKRLGFDKNQILNINIIGEYEERFETLKKELIKQPGIKQASYNNFLLSGNGFSQNVWWEGVNEKRWDYSMRWIAVDRDFISTFDMEFVQGNGDLVSNEKPAFILNESALKYTRLKDPINKWFKLNSKGPIIGVVKDFHSKSLHDTIVPCVLEVHPKLAGSYLSVKLSGINTLTAIRSIKTVWENIFPDKPFDYFFFDDDYNGLYKEEQKTGKVFEYASFLAIIITLLGVLGMVAITAQQRIKEISIRKILGASLKNIIYIFLKDFVGLIIIANLIAWPAVYYFLTKWLEDFAYKTNINILMFLASGLLVLFITVFVAGLQTVKTTLVNPASILKEK